ncbi:MAG: hypothetical protein WBD86_00440 [Microgenomates group bacterium]
MLTRTIFNIVGTLLFLFIYWKKLKEDYASKNVFTAAFYILIPIGLAGFLSAKFFPAWWFWADLLGISLGFTVGVIKFKFRFFENLEAAVIAILPWLSFVFLQDSILTSSLSSLIGFVVIVATIVLYTFLDAHYKKFTWYKSGKVGFAGLTTLGVFFLIRAAVAASFPFVLSFLGPIDSIISGMISFLAFLLVFNLARQRT